MDSSNEKPASRRELIREAWGCPQAPRLWRWHDFQWSFGPDSTIQEDGLVTEPGGGWWMYCTRCGKAVWQ